MRLIKKILNTKHFKEQPLVLVDIGASGGIHEKWKSIASQSICIAFDADDRDFNVEESKGAFLKKIKVNRIVSANDEPQTKFYLTESPYCSSLLEPDEQQLSPYAFANLFKIQKTVVLPSIKLNDFLQSQQIQYVDWFKCDTQGTDLRILKSLSDSYGKTLLTVELEPGIMNAYKGEDKIGAVLTEMDQRPFWLSSMKVMGNFRIAAEYLNTSNKYFHNKIIKQTPGWAELSFLRTSDGLNERSMLALIAFSILEKQYGFALEIADAALKKPGHDPVFKECRKVLLSIIQRQKLKAPATSIKRFFNKLTSGIYD